MKYFICAIAVCLFIADIFIYFNLRTYLKTHGNETVERRERGLLLRVAAMLTVSALSALFAVLIRFVN